jgi:hypothetical protein
MERATRSLGWSDKGESVTWRKMTKKQWELIKLLCFTEPKPDCEYFCESGYVFLSSIAPNIQSRV